ncbi:MAG: O-antigen ligase family protein, partial [Desulfobacterales bacterium]|nr:O-antigen ligase family protein [Desulfobacterales bacterium]
IFSLTRDARYGLFGLLVLWLFSKIGGRTTIKFLVVLLIAVVTAISFYKYDLSRYTSFETGRFETWKAAVLIVKDHPLLGVAPNTIYQRTDLMDLTAPKYFVYGGYLSPHSSHNDFLSILTEYGPLGLILFVLILKDIGQRLFFASGRYINRENSFILLGTFWGFIVLISQSLKESLIISNPRIAVILLVYLGIGLLVVARSIRPSFNNSGRVMKWTGNVETFKTQPELQS